MRTPIWVIFDPFHFAGDSIFDALKVDNSIVPFVTASSMSNSNPTGIISSRYFSFLAPPNLYEGGDFVKPFSKELFTVPRRPGDVGLSFTVPILATPPLQTEYFDLL